MLRVALIHAQFETIHPFLDGNGRIGRLLIAVLMRHWALLDEPLLYLSGYLKQHQAEYYRRLSAIRTEGDWEGWIVFFLEAVSEAAMQAERAIVAIASLLATDRRRLLASSKVGPASYRLFEMLPMMPRFSIERVRQRLDTSFPTATVAVNSELALLYARIRRDILLWQDAQGWGAKVISRAGRVRCRSSISGAVCTSAKGRR